MTGNARGTRGHFSPVSLPPEKLGDRRAVGARERVWGDLSKPLH